VGDRQWDRRGAKASHGGRRISSTCRLLDSGWREFIDLTPPNAPPEFRDSIVLGIHGGEIVGQVGAHPARWSGPNHAVQLLSGELGFLYAIDANGGGAAGTFIRPKGVQPGGETPTSSHAVFITPDGTTIDLNPGTIESRALGISGNQEVGDADDHAAYWRNTPQSFVDLNPPRFDATVAASIAGGQIVGSGLPRGARIFSHALLWMDATADSVIDLNPVGFVESHAAGLNTTQQWIVGGGGRPEGRARALLWTGNASSPVLGDTVVDLSSFLPGSLRGGSTARAIDEQGNIVGFANGHAVMWIPTSAIPLPAAAVPGIAMLGIVSGALTLLRRERAKAVR
jgi:hypothetical protein